jgi:4-amino-4-deoxy-L-arabinose transferase-like glycosyltransferase
MRNSWPWLVPFAVALGVAGATRLCFPFDGLYGQDAFAYFRYARALGPHLFDGAPLPALYWPVGYPVTVALLLPLTGNGPGAGQIVSMLTCAWAAAATALLVRELERLDGHRRGDPWAAILAGLTVAVSGAVLRSSQVVMADGLGLGAAAAALYCAVRHAHARDGRGSWLVAVALSLAWGAAARWMVGLLVFPIGAFLFVHSRAGDPSEASAPWQRPQWPWVLAAGLAGLAVLVPVLAVARSVPLSLERHEWLLAWNLRNAFARELHTPEGHAIYRLPIALFYLVRLGWPDYFFPVHALFALAGARSLARERPGATALLLLGWPAVAWMLLSGIPYENPRFLLPTLPAIGALFGIGLAALRRRVASRGRALLTLIVLAAQAAGVVFGAREHARLVARKNADRDLVAWAAERMTPDAQLVMAGPSLAFRYYASIPARDLFSTTTEELDALVAGGAPLFVLADVDELETQWPGLAPERHFHALAEHPGLDVLGIHSPYTLFRVRPAAGE